MLERYYVDAEARTRPGAKPRRAEDRGDMRGFVAIFSLLALPWPAFADDLPPCALTGSMTMMIGGKPALRLSDVAKCPPELYEVIHSITIDGQPMVHFRSGQAGKMRCVTLGNATVSVEGKMALTLGDVSCAATN